MTKSGKHCVKRRNCTFCAIFFTLSHVQMHCDTTAGNNQQKEQLFLKMGSFLLLPCCRQLYSLIWNYVDTFACNVFKVVCCIFVQAWICCMWEWGGKRHPQLLKAVDSLSKCSAVFYCLNITYFLMWFLFLNINLLY